MQFEMGTSWRASSRSGSESGLTDVGPGWSRCLTSNETRETVVILWHDWSGLFFPRHVMEGMWYDRSSISRFYLDRRFALRPVRGPSAIRTRWEVAAGAKRDGREVPSLAGVG
jgi:hypothetical protein